MNVVLIGMPGCGKSTIGVVLAKTMGYEFIDSDIIIQQREKMLLQQIIDEKGADYFFQAEQNALLSIDCDHTVIATGGSAVYSEKGMEHLKKNSIFVYISLSYENIKRRLRNIATRGIVGAKNSTIEQIYSERTLLYSKYADISVDCNDITIEQSMNKIKAALKEAIGNL